MWKIKLEGGKDTLYRVYRTATIFGPYTASIKNILGYMKHLDFSGTASAEKVELILPTELL